MAGHIPLISLTTAHNDGASPVHAALPKSSAKQKYRSSRSTGQGLIYGVSGQDFDVGHGNCRVVDLGGLCRHPDPAAKHTGRTRA
jgi:hypothetical protein